MKQKLIDFFNDNKLKSRHGFTTFVIIIGIIGQSITGLLFIILTERFLYSELGIEISFIGKLLMGVIILIQMVCLILILKWKKRGFWLFIGFCVINIIVQASTITNASTEDKVFGIVSMAIGIIIYRLILQIRKNGESAWDQLED